MKLLFILVITITITSCGLPNKPFNPVSKPSVSEFSDTEENNLRIIALDVGQGDSTLIISPSGETLLIDSGPEKAGEYNILPFLKSRSIVALDNVVITHFHDDHFGGLVEVMKEIQIKGDIYVRDNVGIKSDSPLFPAFETSTIEKWNPVHPGDNINLGDVIVEIVAANGGEKIDENSESIALLIIYSGFKMFIGGDLTGGGNNTPDVETALAEIIGDIDILRVSHHGSATSTNDYFLSTTKPEAAIISVGENNDYSLPNENVIERLIKSGTSVYQTTNGSIEIDINPDGGYEVKTL